MSTSIIAYHQLLIAPYEISKLQELSITKRINDHARLHLTGIVPEELKDSYVEMTEAQTPIQISQLDAESNVIPLFTGIVLDIRMKAVRDIYYVEIEAISPSYHLDIQRKSRSFQNKSMTYSALIKQVVANYPGVDVMDFATQGASIGKFTMQYQETDWQFLKRMASRFHTGLVPATVFDKPKFYFGVPEGNAQGKLEDFHYNVRKNIAAFRQSSENGLQGISEHDFIYYEVETDKVMEIGHQVEFKGKKLVVCAVQTQMKDGILKHLYTLSFPSGLRQATVCNTRISGVSISGKVIAVAKDNVKVHLDIDQKQSVGDAYWFPYSSVYTAEGNSGWYCMPEVNDYVRIYFPTEREEEGIANSSVRMDSNEGESNKLGNPDVKYFRTAAGKELMFSPQEVIISAKDGEIFIRLNEENGIEIFSKKEIKMITEEDMLIDSQQKVIITAEEGIMMTCQGSSLILLEDSISMEGEDVQTN